MVDMLGIVKNILYFYLKTFHQNYLWKWKSLESYTSILVAPCFRFLVNPVVINTCV